MATVFRARDKRLGRDVALKLIHRHLRQSPEILRRFILEATTIAKLKHRNVVEVYDVSDEDSLERFLVVELIEGCTLREALKSGALIPEVAAAIIVEVGEGLAHAHAHGVVHRDVKPENVLLELPTPRNASNSRKSSVASARSVKVKLTDFGIAKLLDTEGLTSTGQVLGSPSHMAPEQIDGGKVDERADVFALGVLFYECLVGKLPFSGEHPAQVLRRVLAGEFTPAERAQPRVGMAYSRIVSRALSRDPQDRFPTIRDMIDAIGQELSRLQFGDSERLLNTLATEEPLLQDLIVERLIECGDRARAGGNVPGATDALGRALVYRPADRDLIRRLSGLTRRRILGEAARWSGVAAIVLSLGIGFAVLGISPPVQYKPAPDDSLLVTVPSETPPTVQRPVMPVAKGSVSRTPRPGLVPQALPSVPKLAVPAAGAPKSEVGSGRKKVSRRTKSAPVGSTRLSPAKAKKGSSQRRSAPASQPTSPAVRRVVVRITGAMGGTLKIDGEPKQWFGDVQHELVVGTHQFEFISPDLTCCRSRTQTVEVTAGTGIQRVLGQIPFIEATLRVRSSATGLGRLECPTLFSGSHSFPGDRKVPMSRLQATGVCTLRNELAGALPQRRVVRLRAGRTTVIPWP